MDMALMHDKMATNVLERCLLRLHIRHIFIWMLLLTIALMGLSFYSTATKPQEKRYGKNNSSVVMAEVLESYLRVHKLEETKEKAIQDWINNHSNKTFSIDDKNFTKLINISGVNVISMSIYGSSLRYIAGAVRNAELAKVNFPGWTLRFYAEKPSNSPRYELVPMIVLKRLIKLGCDIKFIDTKSNHVPPMMWRFLVADDLTVDRFIIRDSDSRLTQRDAFSVIDWVKSGRMFHSVRDHPSHGWFPISGGLWGAIPKKLKQFVPGFWKDFMQGKDSNYLADMDFLTKFIWPKVQGNAYCSDSVSCDRWPNSYSFPVPRKDYEHVGQVYDEYDEGRAGDIDIIKKEAVNKNCLPGVKTLMKEQTAVTTTVKPVKPNSKEILIKNWIDNHSNKTFQIENSNLTLLINIPGVNVISMSLYGSSLRYTAGAIRNAELAKINFPGWTLRFYVEKPSDKPRYELVPSIVINRLKELGCDIHFIDTKDNRIPPMMWRFLIADDISVNRFIIRDSDSRLTQRDASSVVDWVKSGKMFHSIRDHPSHGGFPVSGGLWGAIPKELKKFVPGLWKDFLQGKNTNYLADMDFLGKVIWPKVEAQAYCSDSVSCDRWPNSYSFSVPRKEYEHVGQVYNEHDEGRAGDIDIIKKVGENKNCLPGIKVFKPNNHVNSTNS